MLVFSILPIKLKGIKLNNPSILYYITHLIIWFFYSVKVMSIKILYPLQPYSTSSYLLSHIYLIFHPLISQFLSSKRISLINLNFLIIFIELLFFLIHFTSVFILSLMIISICLFHLINHCKIFQSVLVYPCIH